jgi:hypothetical protein
MPHDLKYHFIGRSSSFAGETCLVVWCMAILLGVAHAMSLVLGGSGVDPLVHALNPVMIALLLPSIGLAAGHVINWRWPGNDDDAHLVVWLAVGQLAGAAMILPAIGATLTRVTALG